MRMMLFTGGSRSGKSALAQRWAEAQGARRVYIATAGIRDMEMAERVRRHQAARGEGWTTFEEPLDVVGAIGRAEPRADVVLVDCITLWLSNLMAEDDDASLMSHVRALAAALDDVPLPVALVTNEVGWGIVPPTPLGRRFRDLAGECNQQLAAACEGVVLAVSGLPLAVKGTLPDSLR